MPSSGDDLVAHTQRLYRAIYAVVRRIPRGKVATYGQVAELAGIPGGARVAGAAMRGASDLPWQRVLGKRGPSRAGIQIHDPVGAAVQRKLLEDEGVEVSDRGLIDLNRFGWIPTTRARPPRRPRRSPIS
ncbi:MAG TPA: MGMT family protein [Kofleriaceae bacterium]|nr:MGMT family protein [Kofleriaceae bacterium]